MQRTIQGDNFLVTMGKRVDEGIAKMKKRDEAATLLILPESSIYRFGSYSPSKGELCLSIIFPPSVFPAYKDAADIPQFISTNMMLQVVELAELLERQVLDTVAVKISAMALFSTALIGNRQEPSAGSFDEVRKVYRVVQEWKESKKRIEGAFNLYTPEGMTRKRFLQLLSEIYNGSGAGLINELNMEKALRKLLGSDEKISSISIELGYSRQENFITAFRNAFGVTPGQLRRRFR